MSRGFYRALAGARAAEADQHRAAYARLLDRRRQMLSDERLDLCEGLLRSPHLTAEQVRRVELEALSTLCRVTSAQIKEARARDEETRP